MCWSNSLASSSDGDDSTLPDGGKTAPAAPPPLRSFPFPSSLAFVIEEAAAAAAPAPEEETPVVPLLLEAAAATTAHDVTLPELRASRSRLTGTCSPLALINSPSWSQVFIKTRGLFESLGAMVLEESKKKKTHTHISEESMAPDNRQRYTFESGAAAVAAAAETATEKSPSNAQEKKRSSVVNTSMLATSTTHFAVQTCFESSTPGCRICWGGGEKSAGIKVESCPEKQKNKRDDGTI